MTIGETFRPCAVVDILIEFESELFLKVEISSPVRIRFLSCSKFTLELDTELRAQRRHAPGIERSPEIERKEQHGENCADPFANSERDQHGVTRWTAPKCIDLLPDPNPLFGRPEQCIAFLHVVGLIEVINVRHDTVHPVDIG